MKTWNKNNRELLKFTTQTLRYKLRNQGHHLGNYFPTISYELQLANPGKKGCRSLYDTLANKKFDKTMWKTIDKFSQAYNTQSEEIITQITSLNKTTMLIPVHNLQYAILPNVCITNEKTIHLETN